MSSLREQYNARLHPTFPSPCRLPSQPHQLSPSHKSRLLRSSQLPQSQPLSLPPLPLPPLPLPPPWSQRIPQSPMPIQDPISRMESMRPTSFIVPWLGEATILSRTSGTHGTNRPHSRFSSTAPENKISVTNHRFSGCPSHQDIRLPAMVLAPLSTAVLLINVVPFN